MIAEQGVPAGYQYGRAWLDFKTTLFPCFSANVSRDRPDENNMPQLPCPQCDQKISVMISQAGSKVTCPGCQREIPIPTLGELRRLITQSESESPGTVEGAIPPLASESATGRRIVFAILMLIAGSAAVAGTFCAIRYFTIEVPGTSESHIAEMSRMYHEVSAGQLVREWQQMEKYGLDTAAPYGYKKLETEKLRWGRNGLIALGCFSLAIIPAAILGLGDSRGKKRASNLSS
jgi:ribosomal protein S27E